MDHLRDGYILKLCLLQTLKSTQGFLEDVKALGFSPVLIRVLLVLQLMWGREEGVPGGPAWHTHLMACGAAAAVAPEGLGPYVRSLNAGTAVLTSTFLGVPRWSSALSLTTPKSKDSFGDPRITGGMGRGVLWVPRWSESLACGCLGQPRTGGVKALSVSLDQAQTPHLQLWQLLGAKTGRNLQMLF